MMSSDIDNFLKIDARSDKHFENITSRGDETFDNTEIGASALKVGEKVVTKSQLSLIELNQINSQRRITVSKPKNDQKDKKRLTQD